MVVKRRKKKGNKDCRGGGAQPSPHITSSPPEAGQQRREFGEKHELMCYGEGYIKLFFVATTQSSVKSTLLTNASVQVHSLGKTKKSFELCTQVSRGQPDSGCPQLLRSQRTRRQSAGHRHYSIPHFLRYHSIHWQRSQSRFQDGK